jgi:dCTP deaminase
MSVNELPFWVLAQQEQEDRARTRREGGLLPSQHIADLIARNAIHAQPRVADSQIQPASLDLRLSAVGYRVQSSFLPGDTSTVATKLEGLGQQKIDLTSPCVLEKGCVYVIELMEQLALPEKVWAKANPKSTTGRLDVFARLVADYATLFDTVPVGHRGKLYLEVVPRTFSVIVRAGTKLNQLRFMRGAAISSDTHLRKLDRSESLVYKDGAAVESPVINDGLWISIDLNVSDVTEYIGYKAKKNASFIDLECVRCYDPEEFWDPIPRPRKGTLVLDPNEFYILASKERLRVPPQYAAEMVPYDPAAGEFRVHYAGFFDPGFGYGKTGDVEPTRAVLEVRSHEVPFLLEDGQKVGRLVYERLAEDPNRVYGGNIGSSYQAQGLALSKQFRPETRRGFAAVEGLRELAGRHFVDLLGGVAHDARPLTPNLAVGGMPQGLDSSTLLTFVDSNKTSRRLDERIAPLVAATLVAQRDVPFLEAQATRLLRHGVDSIERLESELDRRAEDIVDFARIWLEGERQPVIVRGVGVLFLYYVLVAAGRDPGALEAILQEDNFSYPELRHGLARQIVEAWADVERGTRSPS